MIKKHIVKGSSETSIHDLKIKTEGMNLIINGSHYTSEGKEVFKNYEEISEDKREELEGATIEIVPGHEYQVWINKSGIEVLTREIDNPSSKFDEVSEDALDRLAWFEVPVGAECLEDVEINVIEMEE